MGKHTDQYCQRNIFSIHDFLVQFLETCYSRKDRVSMSMAAMEDNTKKWKIDRVCEVRRIDRNHYLIKWAEWPSKYHFHEP